LSQASDLTVLIRESTDGCVEFVSSVVKGRSTVRAPVSFPGGSKMVGAARFAWWVAHGVEAVGALERTCCSEWCVHPRHRVEILPPSQVTQTKINALLLTGTRVRDISLMLDVTLADVSGLDSMRGSQHQDRLSKAVTDVTKGCWLIQKAALVHQVSREEILAQIDLLDPYPIPYKRTLWTRTFGVRNAALLVRSVHDLVGD
jgi:hypothetical protein